MNEQQLMIFIQKILTNGSATKADKALYQLRQILVEQHVSQELIDYVNMTIASLPEARETAAKEKVTRESLEIAAARAKARKAREEEMRNNYRGCR